MRSVLVAFVQRALGCGCAEEVISTARLSVDANPLREGPGCRCPGPAGRHLQDARIDLLIDVPGRALFLIALDPATAEPLNAAFDAATLVKEKRGYNRVRLFTLGAKTPPEGLRQLDKAITWEETLAILDSFKECGETAAQLRNALGL